MKRRFSLFTYPVMDMKAAEAMLNRRAEQGWRLEKIRLGLLASFVPAEAPVRYCIDWIDPVLHPDRPSYAALLAEAGWRRRALVGSWAVYEAPAGTLPIQTDSALEYQRFRKKVLRRMAIGGAVAAVILLLLLGLLLAVSGGRFAWRDWAGVLSLSSVSGGLLLPLPLLLAGGLLWLGRMALRLWQWKRAAEAGEPFPVPGRVSAGAARLCVLLGWAWGLLILAALALDILDGKANAGWAVGLAGGGFLAGKLYPDMDEELRRRQRRVSLAALVLAAVVLIAPWLLPSGLTAPLYPDLPPEGVRVLPEAGHYRVALSEERSLLAAYSRWQEGAEDQTSYLMGEYWSLRSDFLADRVAEEYRAELGPEGELPGYRDVWTGPVTWPSGGQGDAYLIRRGNAIVYLESDAPPDGAALDGVITRLEDG